MLTLALTAPPPQRTIVNGQEVVKVILFGYVVPKWAFVVIGLPLFAGVHYLLTKALDAAWPDGETVEVEKVFARADGGYVAWQPEVPGTASPMEYTPPTLDQYTTAREFLTTYPPNAMRTLLGVDTVKETMEFDQILEAWLRTAPEETLHDLLPVAQELQAAGLFDDDASYWLFQAHQIRGIPTKMEYEALTGESID